MTLYTIVPDELIFKESGTAEQEQLTIDFEGILLQVQYEGGHSYRIDRIISTDPSHFFNQSVQPGGYLPVIQGIKPRI